MTVVLRHAEPPLPPKMLQHRGREDRREERLFEARVEESLLRRSDDLAV